MCWYFSASLLIHAPLRGTAWVQPTANFMGYSFISIKPSLGVRECSLLDARALCVTWFSHSFGRLNNIKSTRHFYFHYPFNANLFQLIFILFVPLQVCVPNLCSSSLCGSGFVITCNLNGFIERHMRMPCSGDSKVTKMDRQIVTGRDAGVPVSTPVADSDCERALAPQ